MGGKGGRQKKSRYNKAQFLKRGEGAIKYKPPPCKSKKVVWMPLRFRIGMVGLDGLCPGLFFLPTKFEQNYSEHSLAGDITQRQKSERCKHYSGQHILEMKIPRERDANITRDRTF